jgi:competence protein ComEC
MFSWTPYALVRVALVFTAGIVLGLYFPELLPIAGVNFVFAFLFIGFTVIAYLKWKGKFRHINIGFAGVIALFLAGYINVYYSTDHHRGDHFIHDRETVTQYKALISKQSQEKENLWKVEAEVQAVQHENESWVPRSGKVLLYFSKKNYDKPFQYGDVLLIKGNPEVLKEPANPGEFDYRKFLTYRKTYHQHFLREGGAVKIGYEPSSTIVSYSIMAREWADRALKENVHGEQEQATASALVLGVTDGLDNDLIGAYAATGSLHVLSVSGLHVGIIYWLILLIFRPLNKTTKGKWVLAIFSVLVLWGYAFVTGVSPSVLRAVTMFSFVALARPWGQKTNIYNTLAASAFCLLLYEPYLVMSVGFQLSYLAVVGIVYLQPKLSGLWEPRAWLWDQVWQITCVSIAAQAATVAIGLLYFHQFPVYFLFSNLFVIPISFVVLVLGIVVVLVSFFAPVAAALGFLLQWTIWFLNYGIFKMEALPWSLIDNVYISTFQCWVLMGAILCTVFLFELRRTSYLTAASVFILIFAAVQWIHFHENINQKKFVVYNVSGHSAWDVMHNGQVYFFSDSALMNDRDKLRFHIRPNRLRNGVGEIYDGRAQAFVRELKGCRLIVWNELKILQLKGKEFTLPENLTVDYVLIGGNALYSTQSLRVLKFEKLILDSSNSFYFAERLLRDARAQGIPVHSVQHHGAFIAKLLKS